MSLERFLPFLQSALSLQHCNPCLHWKYKNKYTILHICNVEFAEVPHAIESHMNLCNCAEESAVKILSREEGGGGKNLGKEFMQTSTKDMQQAQ